MVLQGVVVFQNKQFHNSCLRNNNSQDPLTRVSGLVHRHRQLNYVVHSLGIFGLLRLLAHDPFLHQEAECFRWVWPRPAVPLWDGWREWMSKKKRGDKGGRSDIAYLHHVYEVKKKLLSILLPISGKFRVAPPNEGVEHAWCYANLVSLEADH